MESNRDEEIFSEMKDILIDTCTDLMDENGYVNTTLLIEKTLKRTRDKIDISYHDDDYWKSALENIITEFTEYQESFAKSLENMENQAKIDELTIASLMSDDEIELESILHKRRQNTDF